MFRKHLMENLARRDAGEEGKARVRDELVDDVAERVDLPLVVPALRLERVKGLLLAERFADEAEPEHPEEHAAHEVRQPGVGFRV